MSTSEAAQFLSAFLGEPTTQQQLADHVIADGTLTFAHWQHVASGRGWAFAEADFDAALAADPTLMPALEQLADTYHLWPYLDLDFELSEAELEAIAGGSGCPSTAHASVPTFKV